MKTKLLIAAVIFFGLSVAAFAQATYTVGSIPVTYVVRTGITEKAGDITFTTIPTTGPTVTGTITIDYGTLITFPGAVNVGTGGPTITYYLPGSIQNPNTNAVVLVIAANNSSPTYTFTMTGVRVDVGDNPTVVPMRATITAVGNAIVAGQQTPQVINFAQDGIRSFTGSGGLQVNDMSGAITVPVGSTNPVRVKVSENFLSAFGLLTDVGQNTPQQLKIHLDQTPQAGITVTFPAADITGRWVLMGSPWGPTATTAYYQLASSTDITLIEDYYFDLTVAAANPALGHYRYTDTTVNANITLSPVNGEISPDGRIVRYNQLWVGPVPLYTTWHPANRITTLLVPYAVDSYPIAYDTGFVVANTTIDPGFSAMGWYSAIPLNGLFKFYLYNNDGSVYTVDSSVLPPKGILSGGVLAGGKTYTVLLSEVLAAATPVFPAHTTFSGYIFIVAQFPDAHGEFFISDFNNFTHGALMLVIANDRDLGSENLNN